MKGKILVFLLISITILTVCISILNVVLLIKWYDEVINIILEHSQTATKGDKGEQGERGADGFSPQITVYENTAFSYKLQIKTADNEYITPDLRGNAQHYSANLSTAGSFIDGISF